MLFSRQSPYAYMQYLSISADFGHLDLENIFSNPIAPDSGTNNSTQQHYLTYY